MLTDSLSTLALATGGAFLGKFVGPAAESLGKVAWERAQQLSQRATAMLAATGREPQPVELKVLLPLVQAASLESDPTLAEKWAALLANAADPAQRMTVPQGYIEVLRQLTPIDAQVVEAFYTAAGAAFDANQPHGVETDMLRQQLELDRVILSLSIDTMLRLRLCKAVPTHGDGDASLSLAIPRSLLMTFFGWQFRAACMPPTS